MQIDLHKIRLFYCVSKITFLAYKQIANNCHLGFPIYILKRQSARELKILLRADDNRAVRFQDKAVVALRGDIDKVTARGGVNDQAVSFGAPSDNIACQCT